MLDAGDPRATPPTAERATAWRRLKNSYIGLGVLCVLGAVGLLLAAVGTLFTEFPRDVTNAPQSGETLAIGFAGLAILIGVTGGFAFLRRCWTVYLNLAAIYIDIPFQLREVFRLPSVKNDQLALFGGVAIVLLIEGLLLYWMHSMLAWEAMTRPSAESAGDGSDAPPWRPSPKPPAASGSPAPSRPRDVGAIVVATLIVLYVAAGVAGWLYDDLVAAPARRAAVARAQQKAEADRREAEAKRQADQAEADRRAEAEKRRREEEYARARERQEREDRAHAELVARNRAAEEEHRRKWGDRRPGLNLVFLASLPDARKLVTLDSEGRLEVSDAADGRLIRRNETPVRLGHPTGGDHVSLSADGSVLAVTWTPDRNGGVSVFSVDDGRMLATRSFPGRFAVKVAMSADGKAAFVGFNVYPDGGGYTSSVERWGFADGSTLASVSVKLPREPFHLTASPDGRFVAFSTHTDDGLLIRDARNLSVVKTLPVKGIPVFSPDGRTLATISNRKGLQLELWDLSDGKSRSAKLECDPRRLCFSPDGTSLAGIDNRGGVHLWTTTDLAYRRLGRVGDGYLPFHMPGIVFSDLKTIVVPGYGDGRRRAPPLEFLPVDAPQPNPKPADDE
jgi:hypothetical protein